MLFVNPPVCKPSEPPAGIARLAGLLRAHGYPCQLLDGSLEGLFYLLEQPLEPADTWTRRALASRVRHTAALWDPGTYGTPDRYIRAVNDLNRLALAASGRCAGLTDYRDHSLSPVRSDDLLAAAEHPERNPFYPWFSRRLLEILYSGETSTVGISLSFLSQALTSFAIIGFLRKAFPQVKILLGGGLVTSWMSRPGWRNPFVGLVDLMVAGPGEEPLLRYLGIEPLPLPVLPRYEGFPLDRYLSPGRILPYTGSSGCWWRRCSFCPEAAEGNRYVAVPASQALSEITELIGRCRPVLLHLLDNAVSSSLLRLLAAEPPGVPWYGFARITPELAEREFCRALRRSGCVVLKLGLESGDQGVLDRLHKGIELSVVSRVLRNLEEAGIAVYLYLLFGTPAEDEASARKTLEFTLAHASAVSFLNLAIFNMPVNAADASEYQTDKFYEGDLSLYSSFRHPSGWERGRVRTFVEREFARHPAIAPIVRRDPPFFTSNHAPFFTAGFREVL